MTPPTILDQLGSKKYPKSGINFHSENLILKNFKNPIALIQIKRVYCILTEIAILTDQFQLFNNYSKKKGRINN